MPGSWDLDIDTYWIRRAAGSTADASRSFGAVMAPGSAPLSAAGLGPSDAATTVVLLVNVRNGQAHAAAAQLRAVATGVGHRLGDAADRFDLVEATIARPTR